MVLDAILLSLAEIVSKESPPRSVAILSEMKVKVVLFTNPVTRHEVWFDGSVDYAITRVIIKVSFHHSLLLSGPLCF